MFYGFIHKVVQINQGELPNPAGRVWKSTNVYLGLLFGERQAAQIQAQKSHP